MSPPRRSRSGTRSKARRRPPSGREFWGDDGAAGELDEVIRPVEDPTALVLSLGQPPLPGLETAAEHYFAAVYDKAASLAIALAAASDLLDTDDDEPADELA